MSKIRIKQVALDQNWVANGTAQYQIKNIADPTAAQDAATKNYVDAAITGVTASDTYTTGSTLIGNTIYFDTTDALSAYTTDLSALDVNDTFVTGATISYINQAGTATFTNNDNTTFTLTGITDFNTTGGTYNNGTGDITFTRNDGSTYTVDLSTLDLNDTFVTGGTESAGSITFTNNDNGTFNVDLTNLLTNGSGTEASGTSVNLGGALVQDATITGGGSWNVNLGDSGSRLAGFTTNALTNTITGANGTNTSSIGVTPTTITLTSSTGSTFTLNTTSNIFTDNSSALEGIKYGANYSTTFTNRSLVDKEYVDGIAAGLDPKASVVATTTGAITLSGLTIQGGGDWTTGLTSGDRILVKNQASAVDNGIYTASTSTWGRSADSDGTPTHEVTLGNYVFVEGQNSANTQTGTGWVIVSSDAADPSIQIVPGVDTQIWSKFSEQTTLSNGNGTTANGSAVDLGGTLSQTTSINGNGQYLEFGNFGSKTSLFQVVADTAVDLFALGTGVSGRLGLTTGNAVLITTNGFTSQFGQTRATSSFTTTGIYSGGDKTELQINSGSAIFTDTLNGITAGIQYAADYSANYTNRSLVDKQYVDNSITAITKSINTEFNGTALSGITGGTGTLVSDPFGSDTLDADMTPQVFLNGVKYRVGDATTSGVDAWFATAGSPGTAKAFNALANTDILVWSVANSTIEIDTADIVSVVYTKVV